MRQLACRVFERGMVGSLELCATSLLVTNSLPVQVLPLVILPTILPSQKHDCSLPGSACDNLKCYTFNED